MDISVISIGMGVLMQGVSMVSNLATQSMNYRTQEQRMKQQQAQQQQCPLNTLPEVYIDASGMRRLICVQQGVR